MYEKKLKAGQWWKKASNDLKDELVFLLMSRKILAIVTRAMVAVGVRATGTLAFAQFGPETKKGGGGQKSEDLGKKIWLHVVIILFFANVLHCCNCDQM